MQMDGCSQVMTMCAQVMTWHCDYDNANGHAHGRLFFKYGGYFARRNDAHMPAFHDKHDGFWVSSQLTQHKQSHLWWHVLR